MSEEKESKGDEEEDARISSSFSTMCGCGCGFTDLFWHICGEGASRHPDFTVPPERGVFDGRIMITVETFYDKTSAEITDKPGAAPQWKHTSGMVFSSPRFL